MTAMFTGAVVVARNTLLSAIVTIDKIIERELFGEYNCTSQKDSPRIEGALGIY